MFDDEGTLREMFNPEIVYRKGLYLTEEGCLCRASARPSAMHHQGAVAVTEMHTHIKNFTGWTAQIISTKSTIVTVSSI